VSAAGRVCLLTGAAQGVGAATAAALHARGAHVVLTDVRGAAARAAADGLGGGALGLALDVTDPDAIDAAIAAVLERHGRLDVLVNNAGIGPPRGIDDLDAETWEQTLAVNLSGPYRMVRAALPALRRSRGHIVNVASLSADLWTPLLAHYNAAKAGVAALSETLRIELAPDGVALTTVYLGRIDTPMLRSADTDPHVPPKLRAASARIERLGLLRRLPPQRAGEAIAEAVAARRRVVYVPGRVRLARWFPAALQRGVEALSR